MKLKNYGKKRSMKERLLKEGPGAGYTITAKGFSNVQIASARVVKADGNGGTVAVEGTCTIDELYAESYYYGTGKMVDIPAAITEVYISEYDLGYDENGDDEDISKMSEEELIVLVRETVEYYRDTIETVYGGGWLHATYDGSIEGRDEPIVLQITDKDAINFIDLAVQGENLAVEYRVRADYGSYDEWFDDEDEAIAQADALANDPDYAEDIITVERVSEYYDFEGMPFDYPGPYFEKIYEVENELRWGDDEDTDYQESFKRKRTESVKRRSRRSRKVNEWHDRTDGSYMQKEEMGKRGVIAEAKRLGARLIKSTDSNLAYRLVDEGFECICYSYDSYGNISACVAGKNVSAKNLPNDAEEYVYTNASGAASSILANA